MSDYAIKMSNVDFWYEGTKSDCARWFCITTNTELFIMPLSNDAPDRLGLFVEFENSGQIQDIAAFENEHGPYLPNLEEAYTLFFDGYLLDNEEPDYDYELKEIED